MVEIRSDLGSPGTRVPAARLSMSVRGRRPQPTSFRSRRGLTDRLAVLKTISSARSWSPPCQTPGDGPPCLTAFAAVRGTHAAPAPAAESGWRESGGSVFSAVRRPPHGLGGPGCFAFVETAQGCRCRSRNASPRSRPSPHMTPRRPPAPRPNHSAATRPTTAVSSSPTGRRPSNRSTRWA